MATSRHPAPARTTPSDFESTRTDTSHRCNICSTAASTCDPSSDGSLGRQVRLGRAHFARFGRLNFFSGLTRGTRAEIDTNKVHYLSLKLLGSTGSSLDDYTRALALVETGKVDVRAVVSHRFGMRDAVAAFDHALSGKGLKTVIFPQTEGTE